MTLMLGYTIITNNFSNDAEIKVADTWRSVSLQTSSSCMLTILLDDFSITTIGWYLTRTENQMFEVVKEYLQPPLSHQLMVTNKGTHMLFPNLVQHWCTKVQSDITAGCGPHLTTPSCDVWAAPDVQGSDVFQPIKAGATMFSYY